MIIRAIWSRRKKNQIQDSFLPSNPANFLHCDLIATKKYLASATVAVWLPQKDKKTQEIPYKYARIDDIAKRSALIHSLAQEYRIKWHKTYIWCIKLNVFNKMSISDADNNNDYSHRSPKNNQESKRRRGWLGEKQKKSPNDSVQWQPKKSQQQQHQQQIGTLQLHKETWTEKKTKANEKISKRMGKPTSIQENIRRQTRQSVIRYFYWLTLINIITNNNNMYQLYSSTLLFIVRTDEHAHTRTHRAACVLLLLHAAWYLVA